MKRYQLLKIVKDITSKGFVRNNYKKNLVDLSDVNKAGLNDNDVLVYDQDSGKFVAMDITTVNDNDGGEF